MDYYLLSSIINNNAGWVWNVNDGNIQLLFPTTEEHFDHLNRATILQATNFDDENGSDEKYCK